jgi:glutamine cyclotransferase
MKRVIKIWLPVLIVVAGAVLLAFFLDLRARNTSKAPVYRYKIINTYPHDRNAFTQGLVFDRGVLYEGTGNLGRSELRQVELETGQVLRFSKLGLEYFGEGITVCADKIIQLTWKAGKGFVYDKESFKLLAEFSYPTEGWGITCDGENLIMSDGTAMLHFRNPHTFEITKRLKVRGGKGSVEKLNELEYIRGEIYANVWEDNDRLFVTGKFWPKLFEIELAPSE